MSDPAPELPLPRELLFELNPNPMWVFDLETLRFLAVNQATIRRYGYSRDELLGMTIRDIRPASGMAVLERWLTSEPAEREVPTETRHRYKDGTEIDVDIFATPFEAAGRRAALVCAIDATPRKRAEAQARRMRAVMEKGADGVILSGADGVVLYVSPAMERIIGIPAAELVGQPTSLRANPDDLVRDAAQIQAVRTTPGTTQTILTRQRHGDGSWRWIEATVTNLLDDPTVAAVVTIARDVSARVEAQIALRDARARLTQILSATSAVTWTMTPDRAQPLTFIGENVRDLIGYGAEAFLGDPSLWWSLIHDDDVARVRADVAALLADGGPERQAMEYRLRHKLGGYRWIREEVVARREAGGAVIEVIGCWIDLTARRDMEEALRRSEARFRTLTERLPLGVMVHRAGEILYVNRATASLLGVPDPASLRGRSLYELAAPEMREVIRARIDAFRRDAPAYQPLASGEMVRADGSRVEVEAEALRIDFDGAPAMLLLLRDLTERNEMVARLAVADRMRSVGMLAAGVAHEINNPLTYVLANLDRIAAELPAIGRPGARLGVDQLAQLVHDAREGAGRVRDVVRDLRTLSRADDEPAGSADLREVLESCIKMADSEIRFRARLRTDLEPAPPVRGSASRLAQVFLNLLINAAHAIPPGHVDEHEIAVRLRAAGERVVVEIADTGTGIPPSILGRIFDPFFTTKPVGVGTGLGLAICHGIVRSVGGEIDVDSEPGRGTTFRVTLPVAPRAPAPAPRPPPPATTPAPRRGHLLIVDDEPVIGTALRLLFEQEHDVDVVTRARDALARIRDGQRYDVILCDLMMPEMNGMDLHAALQASVPEQARRMIFVTGGAFTREAQEFLARCDHPPIEKPFDLRAVGEVLRHMIG